MKFDIGAGQKKSDWITVDAKPGPNVDIVATLPPLPPEVRSASAIRMIHVLEHFHLWEAREILRQCFESLRTGGKLILELPNLQSAIDTLSGAIKQNRSQWGMWVLYGNPAGENPLYGHKWGWTPKTLLPELVAAGFSAKKIKKAIPRFHVPMRDFRFECEK